MPFYCKLCELDLVFTTYICVNCRKIKHYQNIYGKDVVLKVLETNLCNSKFVKTSDIEDTILKPSYGIHTRSIKNSKE